MKIIVTGAAGFIGSNIVAGLNARGYTDIIAVDNLTEADKFKNLVGRTISDYIDQHEFYERFARGDFGPVEAVFHEGACSDTTERDGRYMMDTNYRCSRVLLDACERLKTRLLYASSAAVYGGSTVFVEHPDYEAPLNVYGFSKLLFDTVVRPRLPHTSIQVAGFRYFNVYGPGEAHKGRMASVAFHHVQQFSKTGKVRLFGAYDGYGPGQQQRDFILVDDVVAVKLWCFDNPHVKGIFNLGTGRAEPFNAIAHAVINGMHTVPGEAHLSLEQQQQLGLIEYIPFPQDLVGKYQSHTCADLSALRAAGYEGAFHDVASGVGQYVKALTTKA